MNRCGCVFRIYTEGNEDQGLFLLSQVTPFKVALIGLNRDSNRWADPIEVYDPSNLSSKEMRLIGLNENCSFVGILNDDLTIDTGLKAFLR
jgi:hypothetical protein